MHPFLTGNEGAVGVQHLAVQVRASTWRNMCTTQCGRGGREEGGGVAYRDKEEEGGGVGGKKSR